MFTFDVFGDSLGTFNFRNSSSVANNTQTRLPSTLSSVSYDYGSRDSFIQHGNI